MVRIRIRKINFRGLAFRYGMFFLVSILVVFIISFYYTFNNSRKLLLEQVEKNAGSLTALTVSKIENILLPAEQQPRIYARTMELAGSKTAEILDEMKDFVEDNEVVYGSILAFEPYAYSKKKKYFAPYYYYDQKQGLIGKVLGDSDYDYFKYDWYRIPKELGKPVWTEPYFDKGGGNTLMCTYSVPFYRNINGKRSFTGVVTVDVSLRVLDSIVSTVHMFRTGFGFLISKGGQVIAFPDRTVVSRDFYSVVRSNEKLSSIAKRMMNGESGFENLTGLTRNKEARNWIYYAPVPSTGWSLGLIIPEEELYEGLIGFFYKLFGVFILGIIAIFLITILITRNFMKPISKLARATHEIGKGNFNAPLPIYRSGDEISQLSNSFLLMQEELNSYIRNLQEATAAREKIESELKVAREIQTGMLPRTFPDRKDCDLYAILKSAREVGGDLYDFFFRDQDNLFAAVGDVSGKGVPASLFMAVTRTLFRARVVRGTSLCAIMEGINNELVKENPNQIFVTMVAGILNLATGEMEICNAGHNPPLIFKKNREIQRLNNSGNIPLGIFAGAKYHSGKEHLETGDTILFFTDGITEACNPSNELYREQRIFDLLKARNDSSPEGIAEDLVKDVKNFEGGKEQSDDITLLVLKFNGRKEHPFSPEDSASLIIRNQVSEIEKISEKVEELAMKWSIDPKMAMEVNLILEELVSNIIFYAFDDGGSHEIRIDMAKDEEELLLTVTDSGRPFNLLEFAEDENISGPAENRKIGGLGIRFIRTLAGSIEYARTGNKNVIRVTRKFNIKHD